MARLSTCTTVFLVLTSVFCAGKRCLFHFAYRKLRDKTISNKVFILVSMGGRKAGKRETGGQHKPFSICCLFIVWVSSRTLG